MKTNYNEYNDSQLPAIQILQKMGWTYLSAEDALSQRDGLLSNVILEDILFEQLAAINNFEYKGETYQFSHSNIQSAINALKNVSEEGSIVNTNEKVYDLLTLGKSFEEVIQGDKKAFSLRFIDWKNWNNNVFHVAEEFIVEGIKEKRRPDIVLFVNGIPFVVIENKRRDKNESIEEAISQNIRNQKKDAGIPRLFHYAQILLAVHPNEVKYGATGTPLKFWATWKEDAETEVQQLIGYGNEETSRLSTAQDCGLYSLCNPKRLMDLVYKYIVFDGPHKKICRYQQYFAVEETIKQVSEFEFDLDNKRKGGVIWHTTGSGKSLTMVMLSKALALNPSIESPRVIIVTDRISLDKQIYKTFENCGKNVKKAKSGSDLIELLKDQGNEIITTILDKFQTAVKQGNFVDSSHNIFVLVDESHRSQYGTANVNMRKILPNACYIGFTGTPLLKQEKSTAKKFGGFIHKYTIDQAVKDEAVLPLLYEGRSAKLSINKKQIDKGFERLSESLSEDAQKDLKRKFASISKIYESEHVVEEIAFDISKHFCTNWQGTGFKAQLAVPKIDVAIRYQKYFETQENQHLKINTYVVFTPPDSRQSNEDVWQESSNESKKYWDALVTKFGSQDNYENWVVEQFKEESNEVEIIIVVSKLLTGFDAPRNTVLYLAKPLHSHNLLQAIARVNRLFEGKEYGHIIDYVGVLGKLDEALTNYSAFEDFDAEDLTNAVIDILTEVRQVPIRHAEALDVFKGVQNKNDIEALERHLAPKDIRDRFYELLSAFARTMQTALSSDEYYVEFTEQQINFYRAELKRLQSLRKSVQFRYADVVSYKEYEPRIRKLLDSYVDADEVQRLTFDVNVFNKKQVAEALETYGKTAASKADFIANNMKKVIHENMEKDEAFYKKFSDLIEETILAFQNDRISEAEYLEKILKTRDDLESGYQEGIPSSIQDKPKARAFFGAVSEVINLHHGNHKTTESLENIAKAGIDISEIVERLTIRDWKRNLDIQRTMENEIEDYLMDSRKTLGVELTFEQIDEILAKCLKVAKNNF